MTTKQFSTLCVCVLVAPSLPYGMQEWKEYKAYQARQFQARFELDYDLFKSAIRYQIEAVSKYLAGQNKSEALQDLDLWANSAKRFFSTYPNTVQSKEDRTRFEQAYEDASVNQTEEKMNSLKELLKHLALKYNIKLDELP